jgi:uncharacterized RDD family membrane protein YckC
MSWMVTNMKWIMVVSGALTCTMLYAAIAPVAALRSTFGETLGKLVFIGLVVSHGGRYLSQQAGVAVVLDSVMVLLFAGYLVGARGKP